MALVVFGNLPFGAVNPIHFMQNSEVFLRLLPENIKPTLNLLQAVDDWFDLGALPRLAMS